MIAIATMEQTKFVPMSLASVLGWGEKSQQREGKGGGMEEPAVLRRLQKPSEREMRRARQGPGEDKAGGGTSSRCTAAMYSAHPDSGVFSSPGESGVYRRSLGKSGDMFTLFIGS